MEDLGGLALLEKMSSNQQDKQISQEANDALQAIHALGEFIWRFTVTYICVCFVIVVRSALIYAQRRPRQEHLPLMKRTVLKKQQQKRRRRRGNLKCNYSHMLGTLMQVAWPVQLNLIIIITLEFQGREDMCGPLWRCGSRLEGLGIFLDHEQASITTTTTPNKQISFSSLILSALTFINHTNIQTLGGFVRTKGVSATRGSLRSARELDCWA